jgi:hypothetical protein
MSQRDHNRSASGQSRSPDVLARRTDSPVLTLQRAIGNRATGQVLARKGPAAGTFEHSVQIGKLGPIEVTDSNIDAWVTKKDGADELVITTVKGTHSSQLRQMAESKAKIDTLDVSTVTGQNSWVIVTFHHVMIRGYEDASGTTERWKAVGFDEVNIKRTSIGAPRP